MKQTSFQPTPESREKFSVVRNFLVPPMNPTFGSLCYSHPHKAVLLHIYVTLHTYTKTAHLCTYFQLQFRV